MSYRIRRPKEHKALLEKLVGDSAPFQSMYEVITFAATLGYARENRAPFEGSDEPIRWELFQQNNHQITDIVNMLAAVSVEEREILSNEQEEARLRIFEEFANGGLNELQIELDKHPAMLPRDVVLDLVLGQQESSAEDSGFDSIVDELLD